MRLQLGRGPVEGQAAVQAQTRGPGRDREIAIEQPAPESRITGISDEAPSNAG
jgi:hypothetical protein